MHAAWWVLIAAALIAVIVLGPREPVDIEDARALRELADDPEALISKSESRFTDIRAGQGKQIKWAKGPGERTNLSIVYLHGFSASPSEIRPVPDLVGERLGANVYFARLRGHGRDGAAMAEATAGDWLYDAREAILIGEAIGEDVIVIATSTGAALAAVMASDPELRGRVQGLVLLSANFRIARPEARILTWPFARYWLPMIVGKERGFTPRSDAHAEGWTTRYPTVALLPMAALVKSARNLDFAGMVTPALFLYSKSDTVISPEEVERVHAEWGAGKEIRAVNLGPGDDPSGHLITGDIMSPGQTEGSVEVIVRWITSLGL